MKIKKNASSGFTLVEILLVVTIIGILATGAIIKGPVIIRNTKAKTSVNQLESYVALIQAYRDKYNRSPVTEVPGSSQTGTPAGAAAGITYDNVTFADVLHGAGLLDDVPAFKFGDNPDTNAVFSGIAWNPTSRTFVAGTTAATSWTTAKFNRIESYVGTTSATPIIAATGAFSGGFILDSTNPFPSSKTIYVGVYENISYDEARALAEALSPQGAAILSAYGTDQQNGRCVFGAPAAATGTTTAYVYLTD